MNFRERMTFQSITLNATFVWLTFILACGSKLTAQTFTDGFEGSSISSFWTWDTPGTPALSSSLVYNGSQSLQLSASPTFPWGINFVHDFGSEQSGSISVWVQGQQLCCGSAAGLQVSNTAGDKAALLQQSGNINCNSCFQARILNGTSQSSVPFNADESSWHRFQIDVDSSGVTLKFDGATVATDPAVTTFRNVDLTVWGGPGGIGYFDDFSATLIVQPSYQVCLLYDPAKAVKRGATIPIKLQLCDGNGNDLSASGITVRATGVTLSSSSISGQVEDSGNSNPDNDFRFDSTLGGTGGYIFNLSTKGLARGTYNLAFKAGTDPTAYSVPFEVK
jgi:hypothetical protein